MDKNRLILAYLRQIRNHSDIFLKDVADELAEVLIDDKMSPELKEIIQLIEGTIKDIKRNSGE
jgi:hypothetical protein